MMPEISELQKKRAENIIWSCAENYAFTPDFKAYDKDGAADLYWNCIIGAVRKHYDYPKIEEVLHSFLQYEESDTYEGLMWLGLENCVFQKEVGNRPVLAVLRRRYASAYVRANRGVPVEDRDFLSSLSLAHWMRVLGEDPPISRYDTQLLDELEFSPDLDTDAIVERAKALFLKWFQILAEEKKHAKHHFSLPAIALHGKRAGKGRYRKFGIGLADHPDHIYGGTAVGGADEKLDVKTTLSASELREFMEAKYGSSMFSPQRTTELERTLCTGSHENCHLHFTYGVHTSDVKIQNAFEALSRQREAAQTESNRKYYQDHIVRNRIAVSRLSGSIRHSVLMHLEPSPVKANAGILNGRTVWRATTLGDENVFRKDEHSDAGNLCVDILLDASTSQKRRQEIISTQGFIIAESLTQCAIPCRVMSFCSMTGYTILRVFREYGKPHDNRNIFDYVSNGCNRDGLAIRASHELIRSSPYEHRLLIVLSDVKPNDVIRIHSVKDEEPQPYESLAGLTDTALEVRRARADGISVICIFTGNDEDVPSAKMVYGKDFVRIQSFDRLAETVGMLIQNQIKNMD